MIPEFSDVLVLRPCSRSFHVHWSRFGSCRNNLFLYRDKARDTCTMRIHCFTRFIKPSDESTKDLLFAFSLQTTWKIKYSKWTTQWTTPITRWCLTNGARFKICKISLINNSSKYRWVIDNKLSRCLVDSLTLKILHQTLIKQMERIGRLIQDSYQISTLKMMIKTTAAI